MIRITFPFILCAIIHIIAITGKAQNDCESATITKVEREGNGIK